MIVHRSTPATSCKNQSKRQFEGSYDVRIFHTLTVHVEVIEGSSISDFSQLHTATLISSTVHTSKALTIATELFLPNFVIAVIQDSSRNRKVYINAHRKVP